MSDQWNSTQEPQQEPQPPLSSDVTESPAEQPAEQPSSPSPSVNEWNADGSYRYVPPKETVTTPPSGGTPPPPNTPPVPPYYSYTPQPAPQPPKRHHGCLVALAIVCSLVVVASVVLFSFGLVAFQSGRTEQETTSSTPVLEISDWDENDGGLSYKEIVNRNFNSTVVISVYESGTGGTSTGIVMSEDGYIITNWHCVISEQTGKAFENIDVMMYDGTVYEDATVIGTDESTDLAVIKIEATGLTPAQFGDSSKLAPGDRVVALGTAAGLPWTATFGYVSALSRDVYEDAGYGIKCVQVDAAINPGNSGGPLINSQGLVVGINAAKLVDEKYEGLAFAIPINEAKVVIDSLLANGYVKGRVALGVMGQSFTSGKYSGFLISSIAEDSSLYGTDAKVGDLIVAIDDVAVEDYGDLRAQLAKHAIGDKVKLKLLRSTGGRVTSHVVEVVLQEQKAPN